MPRLMTVTEICERALRKIGAYSIADTGADGVEMEEARWWLDMLVGHVASRKRTWWLVPSTAPLTLVANTASYNLKTGLSGAPKVQHIVGVWAVNLDSGDREELSLMRRQEFEALNQADTGPPAAVWVDKSGDPTLHVYPKPVAPIAHRLDIVFQKFADDNKALVSTSAVPDARTPWNLFLVTALAAELGAGPVRRLPADEVRDMQQQAERLRLDLEAFDEAESPGEFRRTEYNDF